MFNRKYWKIVKWLITMKKKHNTYSFKLLCSGHEIIIYVEGQKVKKMSLECQFCSLAGNY